MLDVLGAGRIVNPRETARMGLYLMNGLWVLFQLGRAIQEPSYWGFVASMGVVLILIVLAEIAGGGKPPTGSNQGS